MAGKPAAFELMAALAVVHGWLAPALSRRAETGGGRAALPCRRPRLVAVACAASSVNTATTTGESPLGSDGSAAAAMSLERAFAGGDGGGGGGIGPAVESTVEKVHMYVHTHAHARKYGFVGPVHAAAVV